VSRPISPLELSTALKSATPPALLDVRQPEEHAFVALPHSRLIPLNELPARANELADLRDREVVVYCHHGIRSLHAIGYLESVGFTKLANLTGGIDAWSAQVDATVARY
jgi:rhodanese-related sulfurtransferase